MSVQDSWLFLGAVATFMVSFGVACEWVARRIVSKIEQRRQS